MTIKVSTAPVYPAIFEALAPPPILTISEWADAHRVLPATSASRGGRWRTATVPYMAGVMNAVLDPAVEEIALIKSHQVGASESLLNIVGYHIQHDPCPMLFVQPTIEVAETFSKERLGPMIREVPALAAVVRERRGVGTESTLRHKVFPGGFLALTGGNSPNAFARWSVKLAIADDADRLDSILGEGDPAELLRNRTTTFYDRKVIFISTPLDAAGLIDRLYQRSDQRRYFVPCPRCGHTNYFTWNDAGHFRVIWTNKDPDTAHLECPPPDDGGCGGEIADTERHAMVAAGEWRATTKALDAGRAGFHIWSAYSPWVTLRKLAADWMRAKAAGRDSLRVFINTALGEGWTDDSQTIDPMSLLIRRESYGEDVDVPAGVAALTMGVDVQDDRLELLVVGWGPGYESWLIDRALLPGDTTRPEPWQALDEVLSAEYRHALGITIGIRSVCIDSAGHRTTQVYDYVQRNQARFVHATIGRDGDRPIISSASPKGYGRDARKVRLYTIGVDAAKAQLDSRLRLTDKGPGYVHIPMANWADEELAHQLTAEVRKLRGTPRGNVMAWVRIRRNEMLDCAVLAHAALLLRSTPTLEHLLAELRVRAGETEAVPTAPVPRREPWLGRRTGGWLRRS